MNTTSSSASDDIQQLALQKMSAVLGADRARQLQQRILDDLRLELRSPQDLLRFSEALSRLGGFEGAVGAMLGVTAIMRGASPDRS
jgi:hypothetical protein